MSMSTRSNDSELKASTVIHSMDDNQGQHQRRILKQWVAIVTKVWHNIRTDEVTQWRCAAILFVSSLAIFHSHIDVGLAKLWTYLTTSSGLWARWFRHDHWEWLLAVACFNVYFHSFLLADRAVLKASQNGKDHPLRKHRLQDRFLAQQHHQKLQKRQQAGEDVDINETPPMVTKHSPWHAGGYVGELWVYMVPLFIWDKLDPRRHRLIARFGAPTTLQICRDVTRSLLMYDLLFFCGHVLMHKIPFINRKIHAKHHTTTEVRSGDTVRLSVIEQVLEVGFSIVAIRTLKCHPVSRSIYNAIITFLLTELHCGFDFPWTPQNVIPFGLATGSRRHHYHHRNGRHYYQKFFCHVDRLFGFVQKDDDTLLGDSVKPLHQIKDKVSWPKETA
ncbi:fatty acid hydroxylase superfamily protein [Nitzschia inconspicua]|uniref:Fatty acid hydroxylase superfamily protein n=1 Tax=Nitzschia inconspicua TaxID=303405 RepID=A0A9K3KIJ4_9STRA|nr:fatty acid hydroxylase superfamily protein [Nitzschia inconspicua]